MGDNSSRSEGLTTTGCDRPVGQAHVTDAVNCSDCLKEPPQRRHVGLEFRSLFIEKQILRCQHDRICAFRGLSAHILEDLTQRNALAASQRHRAELAASTAAASDLHYAQGATMPNGWNALQLRTLAFQFARDSLSICSGPKQRTNDLFCLAVHQAIDAPRVLQSLA